MTWNVEHNYPGAKDTYQVPVDYPTVGYDTIIASWFTDIFTSILAMQDSLLDLVGKVLLLAGGTMTGDLELNKALNDGIRVLKFTSLDEPDIYAELKTEAEEFIIRTADMSISIKPGDVLVINILDDLVEIYTPLVSYDDIEVSDKTKGLILKSPNNSRFRVEVSDGGVLSTEAL